MRMRRFPHNETAMSAFRDLLFRTKAPSTHGTLSEDGKSAKTASESCKVCGGDTTTRVTIPRHKKDNIVRCPECGKNTGPGENTVRGSTNYTGSPGSFYDESKVESLRHLLRTLDRGQDPPSR